MSDTTFSMNAIKQAFPETRYGSVKNAQYEAYRFLTSRVSKQITLRRIRSIWEGKARRIDGEEKDALRRAQLEETKREQQFLRKRLAEIDTALAAVAQADDCAPFPEVR